MELLDMTEQRLAQFTCGQIAAFFPDGQDQAVRAQVARHLPQALARLERCVNAVRMWPAGQFNYLNSSQYCLYLYFLGNTIWRESQDAAVPVRLFLLNKALNGIDLFYEVEMPEIFFIGHSPGIVLAKASYGNYLVLYQNCTVGKNHGVGPVIGEGVAMYPGSAIIGRCTVADGAQISAGTSVVNRDTPPGCIVFPGADGALVFKPRRRAVLEDIFRL